MFIFFSTNFYALWPKQLNEFEILLILTDFCIIQMFFIRILLFISLRDFLLY